MKGVHIIKTVRKDSVTGYKLDFASNTLTINYKFNKALSDFGSPEYNRYKAILADFPQLTVVVKAGREINTTRLTKRLTYENMATYMGCFENSEALLRRFSLVQKRSKALASPYKYVCDWFKAQFPDYKKSVVLKDGELTIAPIEAPKVIEYKQKMPKAS